MSKRYYWLKLQDDFFTSKRIKKLRRLAGGDTFTIIYLKMQLLSIKSDGILQYSGLEQSFAEELALDLDEDLDNVKVTLNYLASCGLIETSDDINYFLPYAVENTGEKVTSAERTRKYRERLKADKAGLLPDKEAECDKNVTSHVTRRDREEIEIEKELETEKEKEKESEKIITVSKDTVCSSEELRSIMEAWNTLSSFGIKSVVRLVPGTKREQSIRARVKQYGINSVYEAIEKIKNSNFLQGKNDRNWVITFDWFVCPNNFPKVLEGNYDNKGSRRQEAPQTSNPFLAMLMEEGDEQNGNA